MSLSCVAAQQAPRPKKPGVTSPNVRIPIGKLVPDAVFEVGGNPDWLAIDENAWVSNAPMNTVGRFDPKSNVVIAIIPRRILDMA